MREKRRQQIPAVQADPELGLTRQQVTQRRDAHWDNRVTAEAGLTEGQIIAQNCITFFNLVFVLLAVGLALAGSSVKNMAFLLVVLLNTAIGCVQQIRAKRAVDKLSLILPRQVNAVREGQVQPVMWDDLVRDDIVCCAAGDQLCADGVLRTGILYVNEALLTGESAPVLKQVGDPLFSGSFVASGSGRAQLTQVGNDAFAAQLARQAKKDPRAKKSEMMRSLDKLIRVVGIALIPVGLLLFYHEYQVLQVGLQAGAEATVAALVGMIPEGLYLLTSVAMAVSAIKLTRNQVLVQEMNCIEALARADVLCVDKTGTITAPEMAVEQLIPLGETSGDTLEQILRGIYGSRDPENDTAKALRTRFSGETCYRCSRYEPFDPEKKCSTAYMESGEIYAVGAPEWLLKGKDAGLTQKVEQLAAEGLRVLLLCRYEENSEMPLALLVLGSPLRPAAAATFSYFRQQGVCVKILSGDNPVTVSAVARRAGILEAEKYVDATGLQTQEALFDAASRYTVFGRVTPEQKKHLVAAMKSQGHTVAMVGDGVNDVLAMKEADCAVAMAGGAQAARQVAHIVLTQGDFSVMPGIVDEGRRVINNIQRTAALFLVKNIFSFAMAILTLCFGLSYPFQPLHLSLVSALTIGAPGFLLALEPNYERVQGRFLTGVLRRALPGGITNVLVVLAVQAMVLSVPLPEISLQTVCTAVLAGVGLTVLYQVCMPFDRYRRLIWGAMTVAAVGSFALLGNVFELQINFPTLYMILGLLPIVPTLFFAVRRLFDLGDRIYENRRKK